MLDRVFVGIGIHLAAIAAVGLAVVAPAIAAEPTIARAEGGTWTLATEDTQLTVQVRNSTILVSGLQNPAQKWDWLPTPCPVPLPAIRAGKETSALRWEFRDATDDTSAGHSLVLRFVCQTPALELRSVWQALKGPGPIENYVAVVNKSGGNVIFSRDVPAAAVKLRSDAPVLLHSADKTAHGKGRVHENVIGAKARFANTTRQIPLVILNVGNKHGAYFGFEWELGGFQIAAEADPLQIAVAAHPVTEDVTRGPGGEFLVPSVYYGVYQGDIDDGSNRFKRWFWNHKITRSLYQNQEEPWVEVCMQDLGGNGSSSITGATPQSAYDRLAATGAECAKMDFWDGTGKCWYTGQDWQFKPAVWPQGFDFAAKAHKAGMKASLYMGGTYMNGDLTTIAARDAQLEALLQRFDAGWFDMWRTDIYHAPREPMPQTYEGVTNFLYIHDHLIKNRPGYRYENCANGGKYKGFAICRRMTFCTMNDDDKNAWPTRSTYYSNSFAINPVQLKSDLGPATSAYFLRTDMLGAILTWAVDNPVYREHIALYKAKQRPILRGGNVYHILPMADGVNWDGLEFYNPDLEKGSVFLFKPSVKATDGDAKLIKLKGLQRTATYALRFQDRKKLDTRKTGAELMEQGITVSEMTGNQASEIIWIEKVK